MSSSDAKLVKKTNFMMEKKPFMLLKDFLMDDFGSCSSNGFKSFPRRQCCPTTVRYLLDRDLNKSRHPTDASNRLLKRSRSKAAAAMTVTALQRASAVVINAVKSSKCFLPRSFSRKMLKRSYRKKGDNGESEIGRWRSFREYLEEKHITADLTTVTSDTTAVTTATTTTTTTTSNSNSWSGSEFTSDCLDFSSRNSISSGENDTVEGEKKSPDVKDRVRVAVEDGDDSIEVASKNTAYCVEPNAKKGWPTDDEKEQFSPVSILDCPFDDEDEVSSPFRHRLAQMEGKKQKLMQNIRRFESLAQLEPMDLEKKMALSEFDENEVIESPNESNILEKIKTEQKAKELLNIIETRVSTDTFKYLNSDKLFVDFFEEKIEKENIEEEILVRTVEDWINGKPHDVLLDWQFKEGRKAYIKDMEEGGEWKNVEEEKNEVSLDIEIRVWNCLVDELVLDILS